MKFIPLIFACLLFFSQVATVTVLPLNGAAKTKASLNQPQSRSAASTGFSTNTVADVVAKANAFKALLTTAQINTLQQPFTNALAQKWSNLPCGSMCRNGIQFSTLNAAQLAATLDVLIAASGTAANEGYDEFNQIRLVDSVLGTVGGSGYSKGIYFISFLNAPTTTGAWMLQFGGHHYAANIAFNGGLVTGTTPTFEGVEPRSFGTAGGTSYAPLNGERAGLQVMLASLSTAQLASAKLSSTYSDVLLGPGQDGNFPATKQGIAVSTLNTTQQNLVLTAMQPWLSDVDDASGAVLKAQYQSELSGTYVAYAGNTAAVAGDSSSFLKANTDYVRIDGPSVWIEFVCQNGVVFSGVHYHTIYRDHTRDYGAYLANTALPLRLVGFDVKVQGTSRVVSWITADEWEVGHYEVERSKTASGGFTSLAQVAAKKGTANTYSFADNDVLPDGISYYRLKMVDKDGYSRYGSTIPAKNNGVKGLAVFPNPARDAITITFSSVAANATITVINAAGKTITHRINQNGSRWDVNISGWPAGTYYVQMTNGETALSTSFAKQ